MFKKFLQGRERKKLTDPHYNFLFDEHPDEWVSFDCETTSLDVKEAEILSIGAVKIRKNQVLVSESFYVLVKPENPMKAANISVHGLRPKDLSDGIPVQEAIKQLLEFIGGRGLVGYYLEYDVAMVNKFLKPMIGIKLPNPQTDVSSLFHRWQQKQNIHDGYVDLRMDTMLKKLKLTGLPRHDALNDSISVALMYLLLKQRLR
ncbi:3'-5' exonuclease [Neisseria zoodegmatis]|uniref:DNA polymerase III polC-type n=1 Tax=Neisseria zoodegmatis TaxID=326523 RepID=A0AB38DTE6_9NEIS|nr:3'-5' exonuclease [Neisseria zoodegmatis]OSI11176.1 DNA polymerase III subunit epsilon [Neisseria zoodegmatis]SNU80534.1 DNA polymerase III polC-type [Neisseria zoodegmatis]